MKITLLFGLQLLLKRIIPTTKQLILILLRRRINIINRDQKLIKKIYAPLRSKRFESLEDMNLHRYSIQQESLRWTLLDNKIVLNCNHIVRERLLEIIATIIIEKRPKKIIELGCGNGQNIIFLADRFKERQFIGLDLVEEGLAASKKAANHFGLNKNTSFYKCDLANPNTFESFLDEDCFVFSMHVLEEMPRIFKIPLITLKNRNVKNICLLEPAFIFNLKRFTLDIARLLRIFNKDRLFGLIRFIKSDFSKKYSISIVDLCLGYNPQNPTSLIYLQDKNQQFQNVDIGLD